jgi:hypothetical protein
MKSLRFETRSGAEYVIDRDAYKVVRLDGPYSPEINYRDYADGVWHDLYTLPEVTVGRQVYMVFGNDGGSYRITTPVTNVEEVDR